MWVAGPAPGSCHDITMMRNFGIVNFLTGSELLLGDKGYQGHQSVVVPYRGHGYGSYHHNCLMCKFNYELSCSRIIVERAFGRIKKFNCFKHKWRHNLALHPIAFHLIAELSNIVNKFNPL